MLPESARNIALQCCLHDNEFTYWLHCVVIMPDHVHLLITPYEGWSLETIMKRVKGNSSRLINLALGRRGAAYHARVQADLPVAGGGAHDSAQQPVGVRPDRGLVGAEPVNQDRTSSLVIDASGLEPNAGIRCSSSSQR